ncbi:MAG: EF-hand domain-containing protein [Pseudoxanthomonas sp.]
MRKTLIAFSVAAALGASAWAFAQDADTQAQPQPPGPPAGGAQLQKLDTNKDGFISREEAKADSKLAADFDKLDKNKDGKLAREELPHHDRRGPGGPGRGGQGSPGQGQGGPRGFGGGPGGRDGLERLDTDHDGRVSKAEATAAANRILQEFDKQDLNKDGYVDKNDRELRRKQLRDEWFTKADTNHDGKLSKEELEAAPKLGANKQQGHDAGGPGPDAPPQGDDQGPPPPDGDTGN